MKYNHFCTVIIVEEGLSGILLTIRKYFKVSLCLCFRQTASGLGSIVSRAGGLLAPLLNMLAIYHWSIPIVVFSSLTLISGVLSFLLPETRRIELPDSTDEAEANR